VLQMLPYTVLSMSTMLLPCVAIPHKYGVAHVDIEKYCVAICVEGTNQTLTLIG
jgi:hypothetical protein